jgi:hypothetical protein
VSLCRDLLAPVSRRLQIRWAVLNVAELLRRHADTHAALADAMQAGKSVGECISLIEDRLKGMEDV